MVTVGIDGLSEQKITTFAALFGDYGCVEFEECAPAQNAETYYPGQKIYVRAPNDKGDIVPTGLSIGFRCKRTVSSGTIQKGYVTCGHGCKDSEDGYVYVDYGNAANKTNPKGKIYDATFSGSVDASYNSTLEGVAFRNRVRVEGEFSKEGDSGGIVYTYANNAYVPCGIISSSAARAPYFSVFVKASEIAYYLNVQPF